MKNYRYANCRPVKAHLLINTQQSDAILDTFVNASKSKGLLSLLDQFERHGYIDNFRSIYKKDGKKHVGFSNIDEFVYKWMEAAAFYCEDPENKAIINALDTLIDIICAAQDQDGYLNSYYQNQDIINSGAERFSSSNRFEFYDCGHLITAAIAHFNTTGDHRLLDCVSRFADLIVEKFHSPGKLPYTMYRGSINLQYEHPQHEIAFVELYRLTGNEDYLKFAKQTLDEYEFWSFLNNYGHAVQVTNLNIAATDIYLEHGKDYMLDACNRIWDDMYKGKMYITGGIGSHHKVESFGEQYELPNQRAYAETCAAISNFMFTYRMLLITGHIKYSDCMERILYNGILPGVSIEGTHYFYTNPLLYDPENIHFSSDRDKKIASRNEPDRYAWHACPCCPPNVHRLLASIQNYIYQSIEDGLKVSLYMNSRTEMNISNHQVIIQQHTNYPFGENIEFDIQTDAPVVFQLDLRIPAWCEHAELKINGTPAVGVCAGAYYSVKRTWENGDKVLLKLPATIRLEAGHPQSENYGCAALMRGPLVYCAEKADNLQNDIFSLMMDPSAQFSTSKLNIDGLDVIKLSGRMYAFEKDKWNQPYLTLNNASKIYEAAKPVQISFVPYFAWANRGADQMRVWFPIITII